MSSEIIESTSVELEPANDNRTLFRTSDPVEVLEAAKRVANALKAELQASGMVMRIGGSEHVKAEGWATLGAMVGVTTSIVWSRPVEDGWEARAEVRTLDGRLVGAGEAMCTRAERNWARRDPFALRSMAQTRAASKALRVPLAFVMTLSGYAAAPADEMEPDPAPELPAWAQAADTEQITRAWNAAAAVIEAATGNPDPPEDALRAFGRAVRDRCDGIMPVCVASTLEDLATVVVWSSEPETTP